MSVAVIPNERIRLRDRPQVVRWSSHLVYLVLIAVFTYVTHWSVTDGSRWAIEAVLVPLIVAAVIMRGRFPYALPLVGVIAIFIHMGYAVYALGMTGLAIRRREPLTWAVAGMAGFSGGLYVYRTVADSGWLSGGPLLNALIAGTVLLLVPTLIGRYIGAQRRAVAAAAADAARATFDRELVARRAVIEERERIAGEMHDSIGHLLARVSMQAGALEVRAQAPEEVAAAARIRETARSGLVELRSVMQTLGDDATLAPTATLAATPSLIEASRDAGAQVTFVDDLADASLLPSPTGRVVYKVVREALTNAHRHAPGAPVRIELTGAPGVGVRIVADNALVPGGEAGSGTGIESLRRRAATLGGTLEARASHGRFTLSVWLPWEEMP